MTGTGGVAGEAVTRPWSIDSLPAAPHSRRLSFFSSSERSKDEEARANKAGREALRLSPALAGTVPHLSCAQEFGTLPHASLHYSSQRLRCGSEPSLANVFNSDEAAISPKLIRFSLKPLGRICHGKDGKRTHR